MSPEEEAFGEVIQILADRGAAIFGSCRLYYWKDGSLLFCNRFDYDLSPMLPSLEEAEAWLEKAAAKRVADQEAEETRQATEDRVNDKSWLRDS